MIILHQNLIILFCPITLPLNLISLYVLIEVFIHLICKLVAVLLLKITITTSYIQIKAFLQISVTQKQQNQEPCTMDSKFAEQEKLSTLLLLWDSLSLVNLLCRKTDLLCGITTPSPQIAGRFFVNYEHLSDGFLDPSILLPNTQLLTAILYFVPHDLYDVFCFKKKKVLALIQLSILVKLAACLGSMRYFFH